jgi:hypothetical protein
MIFIGIFMQERESQKVKRIIFIFIQLKQEIFEKGVVEVVATLGELGWALG